MHETVTVPTRWLKAFAAAARGALWILALVWVVILLVWGGLHFLIVPRIAEFRPWLEERATQKLGVNVRIGSLTALSNGLIPSVQLGDVTLADAQGREALRLPRVLAALSPRSALGLGFEQLYIEAPVLEVRRTADGQFWIAGLPMRGGDEPHSSAMDWAFSQAELVVRRGTVRWTDELRGAPMLELSEVDAVLRNRHRSHALRLDASPPAVWGERFTLLGQFQAPLLRRHAGAWRDWQGQLFADFARVDLSSLRRHVDGLAGVQGIGALRSWADIKGGTVVGLTADIALREAQVVIGKHQDPLVLHWAAGRVGARVVEGGYEVFTQALEFDAQDGLRWPGGNVKVGLMAATATQPGGGDLVADKLDLAAMAQIAQRLPLPPSLQTAISGLAPKGLVRQIKASWSGPLAAPQRYAVRANIQGLSLDAWSRPHATSPGISGADVEADFNQVGGKARLAVQNGSVNLAGILEESVVALDTLSANVTWKIEGAKVQVTSPDVRFGNADAQGEAQVTWRSGDIPAKLPGVLDLQATISRAQAAKVPRYLPLGLEPYVRSYVRDAVVDGQITEGRIKVKGPLQQFPFTDPKQGEFEATANLKDVTFAYVPAVLLPKDSLPWPALVQASGEFRIDHAGLQVKGVRASLAGTQGLQINKAEATVSNLYGAANLAVAMEARGPLTDILAVINGSPLGEMTGRALTKSTASGLADYRFKLAMPLDAVQNATVQGAIVLAGNELQISPDSPRMSRTRGTIGFSENGFSVTGGQARALGGDVRIEGVIGSVLPSQRAPPQGLRITGLATAEGLRQAKELGLTARLAQYATGSSTYAATLGVRHGVTELLVTTNLAGMASQLPAPFAKTIDAVLPLRLDITALPPQIEAGGKKRVLDQLKLDVGRLATVTYVRDVSGAEAKVVRGSIAVGLADDESAPLPAEGVGANLNLSSVDLDAWSRVLTPSALPEATGLAGAPDVSADASYLPSSLALRAKELGFGGRKLSNVVVGGGREGLVWRANLDAGEINGYVEYRQSAGAAAGRLFARLSRLTIGQSTAQEVETLLDEQPASVPAMDIVVDDFELRGKKLGRLEIDAVNMAVGASSSREWRLNRFNITTPEASFNASGNWTNIVALTEPVASRNMRERRRTAMKFKLDINDAGALIERFGMPGVVRKGRGKVEGRIGWLGSPITFDYASLVGDMNVNIETGQFLKAEPGIAKLLGVLSLQSLPRRLVLDFRDVFSDGFAFDFLRGDVTVEQGVARTNNLQMKGVNAAVLMEGQADIARETQKVKVVVVPEINAGSASLIASTINPVVGLSSFLAQLVLRKPLIEAATQEFLIDGTWVDPRVTKVERK